MNAEGPTVERPLRKDAELNRRRILAAARDLFATEGLAPNLNDVARHAGVGVGTVYRRFATKPDLVEAVFADALDQLTALAETSLADPDSWRGFTTYLGRMCEVTATDRGLREIVFSKCYGGERVTAAQDRLAPVVARLVERTQADGHLRPEVSHTDMPTFALLADSISEFVGHVDDQLWRRYVAILLDGMRNRGDQHRLPVGPLDDDALDLVMRTWEPSGPPARCRPADG